MTPSSAAGLDLAPAAPGPGQLAAFPGAPHQTTIEDLGTPLHSVTFCVVDLETTGGRADDLGITEIGAVKVRGGIVLGEFGTLVNPGRPIPAFISVLTGITDAAVADAPPLSAALPAFLEFSTGCVIVAHNAPYDVGYLRAAAEHFGYRWAPPAVVDTVRLSRQVLARDEVPNHKLGTLATFFRAETRPIHRALDDARATVDVLHGLIGRVGALGVTSLEELQAYSGRVSPAQRRKRHLADGLPAAPGVYVFVDDRGESLYVGTSKNIRTRVRTYFTASETRSRMAEMVSLATSVTPIVCATPLEAAIRELRLIAERKPRYNRRSRFPERTQWLKLTVEAAPRLSIVRAPKDDEESGAAYLGPLPRKAAADVAETIAMATSLRTCSDRISTTATREPCGLAQIGRCAAPCTGPAGQAAYTPAAQTARTAIQADARAVSEVIMAKVRDLSAAERFEEAGGWLNRLRAFLRAADRTQQRRALADAGQIVAALRSGDAWDIHVIRHGRLAGAARSTGDPRASVHAAISCAEQVAPIPGPAGAALPDESDLILAWLAQDGVRLVDVSGTWALPAHGAGADRSRLEPSQSP